MLLNIS